MNRRVSDAGWIGCAVAIHNTNASQQAEIVETMKVGIVECFLRFLHSTSFVHLFLVLHM